MLFIYVKLNLCRVSILVISQRTAIYELVSQPEMWPETNEYGCFSIGNRRDRKLMNTGVISRLQSNPVCIYVCRYKGFEDGVAALPLLYVIVKWNMKVILDNWNQYFGNQSLRSVEWWVWFVCKWKVTRIIFSGW